VEKSQLGRMEHLSGYGERKGGHVAAGIEGIAGNGMTDMGKVHSNLVGSPGFEAKAQQRPVGERAESHVVRNSGFSGRGFGTHFFAVACRSSNGGFNPAGGWGGVSGGQSQVNLFDLAAFELMLE